jgi:hypothetical protein
VEDRFSRGTDPGRDYRGHCYEMAFRYLADHSDEPALRLVHGTLHIVGVPYTHAWIELPGGIVFDPTDQRFYTREDYYRERQATAEAIYTRVEAGQWAMRTKHAGPWHDTTLGAHAVGTPQSRRARRKPAPGS